MRMMDDGKGDVDIHSCRTVRSSASLAAIPQNIAYLLRDHVLAGDGLGGWWCRHGC
jgi:hypothetical protein